MESVIARAPDALAQRVSHSPEETTQLGRALGALLRPGDFVGLCGDLGAGKTQFVRGLSEGAEVPPEEVASPSFAIVYPYQGRIRLNHADFYRLADPDELYATGFFDLLNEEAATVVEWVDKVWSAVPQNALLLRFAAPETGDESQRIIDALAYGERARILLKTWLS